MAPHRPTEAWEPWGRAGASRPPLEPRPAIRTPHPAWKLLGMGMDLGRTPPPGRAREGTRHAQEWWVTGGAVESGTVPEPGGTGTVAGPPSPDQESDNLNSVTSSPTRCPRRAECRPRHPSAQAAPPQEQLQAPWGCDRRVWERREQAWPVGWSGKAPSPRRRGDLVPSSSRIILVDSGRNGSLGSPREPPISLRTSHEVNWRELFLELSTQKTDPDLPSFDTSGLFGQNQVKQIPFQPAHRALQPPPHQPRHPRRLRSCLAVTGAGIPWALRARGAATLSPVATGRGGGPRR